MSEREQFEGWAILELMGHRKLAGYVSEQTVGGAAFLRIDVPGAGGEKTTQLYAPAAIYCITPTTEEIVRQVAPKYRPAPVSQWELAALPDYSDVGPGGDPADLE